jgi:type I restriction enzyme, S subunit
MNGKLPKGWIDCTLENISTVILGQSPPSSTYNENCEGVPFFQGKGDFGLLYPNTTKWCTVPRKYANSGDILISVRAPVGATNINRELSCIGRGLAAVHPNGGINSVFIFYLLQHYRNELEKKSTGTTFDAISGDVLRNLALITPPLNEQNRIVAKIEELFTQLDAGIASLQAAQVKLGQYRKAVLKHAFEGKLTEAWREAHKDEIEPASGLLERIREERRKDKKYKELPPVNTEGLPELPEGWVWCKLDEITEIKGGLAKNGQRVIQNPVTVPYLRVANVQNGYLDLNEIKYIEASKEEIVELSLKRGDILLTEGGDRDKLGRGWIWSEEITPCIYQNHIFRARVRDSNINFKFLSWYCNVNSTIYFMRKGKQTTNLASISLSQVRAMPVSLPPPEEQEVIIAEIDRLSSLIDENQRTMAQLLAYATSLRQSILKKAFEGRLVPQDPSDEPASVLLDRIRQEKLTAEPKKRGRKNNET